MSEVIGTPRGGIARKLIWSEEQDVDSVFIVGAHLRSEGKAWEHAHWQI